MSTARDRSTCVIYYSITRTSSVAFANDSLTAEFHAARGDRRPDIAGLPSLHLLSLFSSQNKLLHDIFVLE
jgi:hypothetical protein